MKHERSIAYNGRGINEVGFLPNLKIRKTKNQFAFIPLLYEVKKCAGAKKRKEKICF